MRHHLSGSSPSDDDRFSTPRLSARIGDSSGSDTEWSTPREAWPSERSDYETTRDSSRSNEYSNEDVRPRLSSRSNNGYASADANGEDESWANAAYDAKQHDAKQHDYPAMVRPRPPLHPKNVGAPPHASYGGYGGYGYDKRQQGQGGSTVPVEGCAAPSNTNRPQGGAFLNSWGEKESEDRDVEDIFSYARHNRLEDIERLLDQGIPVNIRDKTGNTILAISCQNGNKRVAKAALRRGANINAQNYRGNTPLHFCYTYGYGDTLGQYLISKGGDTSILNRAGLTCFEGLG